MTKYKKVIKVFERLAEFVSNGLNTGLKKVFELC
jgi:hypothetical protein